MIKKIFIVLITVVALVLVGALLLNVLLPNTATMLADSIEDSIFKATGISFDINGNGRGGQNANSYSGGKSDSSGTSSSGGNTVQGFN